LGNPTLNGVTLRPVETLDKKQIVKRELRIGVSNGGGKKVRDDTCECDLRDYAITASYKGTTIFNTHEWSIRRPSISVSEDDALPGTFILAVSYSPTGHPVRGIDVAEDLVFYPTPKREVKAGSLAAVIALELPDLAGKLAASESERARLALKKKQFWTAEWRFRNASELNPSIVETSTSLAAVLALRGKRQAAIQVLERALKFDQNGTIERMRTDRSFDRIRRSKEFRQRLGDMVDPIPPNTK